MPDYRVNLETAGPAAMFVRPDTGATPMSSPHYAHTLESPRLESEWELLEVHLRRVADGAGHRLAGAAAFAAAFDSAEWGRLAGLWHDLGKYRPEFQEYLHGKHAGVEHAGAGAALAQSRGSRDAIPLCFAIAGHHTGLANGASNESAEQFAGPGAVSIRPLTDRLNENKPVIEQLGSVVPPNLYNAPLPSIPGWLAAMGDGDSKIQALEFWTRMLFSTLVDADRLATKQFYAGFEPALLHEDLRYDSIAALREQLDARLDEMTADADATDVNSLRAEVLAACRSAAELKPGRFSMTVPTGGGKTLSAMSFALRHAARHDLRRVIVVIPYTSIIEQNAKIYRDALGADNVLEHHSNLDEATLEEQDSEREGRRKLAAENWDAPVVVTTSVQFFESLFSNHPSRCRKLHNIAQSIVILDEVQTLPPQLLTPILDGLRELTDHYGCSVLFSTATPPALVKRSDEQAYGLSSVREIMSDPTNLAKRARRVSIIWQVDEAMPYEKLAEQLAEHDRVLAIVHLRRDARELAEHVQTLAGNHGLFHLSALMCPAHRLNVLGRIREALDGERVCRVVATQLVEAGVDVDFPVVYRALAGLDSLAQAAGRCDREGKLTAANGGQPAGKLVVFRPPTEPPPGVLRKARDSTLTLRGLRGDIDPFDPDTCEAYFHELYGNHDLDERGIQTDRRNLDFATVSLKFRMIDSAMRPLVVPYGDAIERVERFRHNPSRGTQRALQPFLVQVSPSHHATLLNAGAIESVPEHNPRVDVLAQPFWRRYDERFGLDPNIDGVMDPEVTVC